MATLEFKKIDAQDKALAIEALMNYKKQNPAKFEQKKEALFARYGLSIDTPVEPVQDETDVVLETLKTNTKK